MWVRKRIEITPADLLRGFWSCFSFRDRQKICQQIAECWQSQDAVTCLSVRSGFDLLLHSTGWQRGSEIIMSGLTIPDMPRIVEANGYKAVGVDIDLQRLQPDLNQIQRAITPQTRAIVVAHLLGGVFDAGPILALARQHNLMVIEDCAQAYVGSTYQGDERADVSMFSFGPIKTNTALAGAVFRVRDNLLREKMNRNQDQWKVQSRFSFAKRICKYAFVKVISTRPMCGGFYRFMKLFGKNHDGVASSMARGFAGPGFFERIRKQPSLPLLKLLHHKLDSFDPESTETRRQLGNEFVRLVGNRVHVLGAGMERQTWWVLPVLVDDPQSLVEKLWEAGFDASNSCSLHSITGFKDSVANAILQKIVFLPLHSGMPAHEIERLAEIVQLARPRTPEWICETIGQPTEFHETAAPVVNEPHFSDPAELVEPVSHQV